MTEDGQAAVHERKVTPACTVAGNSMLLMAGGHGQIFGNTLATVEHEVSVGLKAECFTVVDMLLLIGFRQMNCKLLV